MKPESKKFGTVKNSVSSYIQPAQNINRATTDSNNDQFDYLEVNSKVDDQGKAVSYKSSFIQADDFTVKNPPAHVRQT